VIGGVVTATVLGVLFVPVFFVVISRRRRAVTAVAAAHAASERLMRKLALLGCVLSTACSLAPSYQRPNAPVANRWQAEGTGRTAADLGWREVFSDARMRSIIELALRHNRDLRIAALNVELVRASYQIERASRFPAIGVGGQAQLRGTEDGVTRQYSVGVNLSYELDLFGRLRNLRAAALEEYLASQEAARAAQISLVAEVANQYLVARAYQEQLLLAQQTLGLVRESSEVTKRLLEQGQRSELDLRTAEAQIETARAEVARVTRLGAQAENALVFLVGTPALPAQLPGAASLESTRLVADLQAACRPRSCCGGPTCSPPSTT
jgi:multidrug efflux system outer membrane protein